MLIGSKEDAICNARTAAAQTDDGCALSASWSPLVTQVATWLMQRSTTNIRHPETD
mgnify:CR=1 FL=1